MKKPTAWVLTAEDDVSIQAVFYRIHFKMEDNMELLNLSEELKNNAYRDEVSSSAKPLTENRR